jgi:hypothetical protein
MPTIGSVRLTPTNPRPGQTVVVEVLDPTGEPLPAASVVMDGRPGAVHHLQYPSEGTRKITVRASGSNGVETKEITIPVTGAPLTFSDPHATVPQTAMMHVRQAQGRPYEATFTLGSKPQTPAVTPKPRPNGPVIPLPHGPHGPVFKPKGVLDRIISKHGTPVESNVRPMLPINRGDGTPIKLKTTITSMGEADIDKLIAAERKQPQRTFVWDFGDGTTATTTSATVAHDYFAALGPNDEHGIFTVKCTSPSDKVTVSRTLVVHSAYAICKKQGAIVPHLEADLYATKGPLGFTGTFTVHNIEDFPIVLDHLAIVPLSNHPDDPAIPSFTPLGTPIAIAAKSSSVVSVNAPYTNALPDSAPGFTVYYGGSGNGTKVRFSHTFELSVSDQRTPPPASPGFNPPHNSGPVHVWPWQEVEKGIDSAFKNINVLTRNSTVVDPVSGTVAVSLGRNSAVAGSSKMRVAVDSILGAVSAPLYVARLGAITKNVEHSIAPHILPRPLPDPRPGPFPKPFPIPKPLPTPTPLPSPPPPPAPGGISAGQVCDPDNLTAEELAQAQAGDLVCQLTNETSQVTMPARFMNARKGDVILSPGGPSIIGQLLHQVDPPQAYSHSGMMTRNFDEITHSTASEERLPKHMSGMVDGSDGFDPNSLKYVWPGVIRQSVDAAVNGEDFTDPEGEKWNISSFSPHAVGLTHNDNFEIVPPLVVKPDPFEETPAVRAALQAAAVEAANGAGRPNVRSKSHYRFFGYTDPVSILSPAGADAGWASGTYGTVCSSFVWSVHHKLGHHLEALTNVVMPTDLEAADVANGAQVRPNNPDGLYLYTAAERRLAAQWLYDYIYDLAEDKAGWFGTLLTDAPDDTANQFVNTFASDDANGQDSDAWQQTGDAVAISPNNILFWDPPSKGGLYGFAEPLQYRESRVETYTISRWKKVLTKGKVHGLVTCNGAGVGGATVQAYDGKVTTTAVDGSYTLTDVPFGSYSLKAQKVIGGVFDSGSTVINLSSADLAANIALQAPPDRYRKVQLYVDFYGVDDESWPWSDEINNPGPEYYELELGPDRLTNVKKLEYKWGGELRVEYQIVATLLANNDVEIGVWCQLYEGTDEDTDDLDGTSLMSFKVPAEQAVGSTLRTDNTDEGGDWSQLAVTAKNVRNNA